ncbi:MAG TPA: DUF427 domain-containing protein [Acidimicrobiia bacterium]|jgi:uncharacterized protein (DUF427 family)/acyl-CoA thioesterase
MVYSESAWDRYPDHVITLRHDGIRARAWFGDLLLAESTNATRLEESKHVDRLYFPVDDVNWRLFTPTEHTTTCPFKGQATYWSLTAVDPIEENVVWSYATPSPEVGGIEGHVAFYQERVRVEIEEQWPDGSVVAATFPVWGDEADLVHLIDVEPAGDGRYVGAPYRDTTRNVVEAGQMLGQGIVAVSKALPRQHVTSASMYFPKAAQFDAPLDLAVDVVREGRTFSTAEVRVSQAGSLRSIGLYLLDAGAADVIGGQVAMPDVAGPEDADPLGMLVRGREMRVVGAAYGGDPDDVGPPEMFVWVRFRDAPAEQYLHQALLSQSTAHWMIAAAMRPHPGISQAQAHVTLSTGPMGVSTAFHDDVDVTQWLLYENRALHAGRGLTHGEGHVFTRDGRLVATYTVHAMLREILNPRDAAGHDPSTSM